MFPHRMIASLSLISLSPILRLGHPDFVFSNNAKKKCGSKVSSHDQPPEAMSEVFSKLNDVIVRNFDPGNIVSDYKSKYFLG